jgi:hypothetical protein
VRAVDAGAATKSASRENGDKGEFRDSGNLAQQNNHGRWHYQRAMLAHWRK